MSWGAHSNAGPRSTLDLACRVVDGAPSLVKTSSEVTFVGGADVPPERMMSTPDSHLERHWQRSVYDLHGSQLVLRKRDSGALPLTVKPLGDGIPLANVFDCPG